MPRRQAYPVSTRVLADGTAEVTFTAPNTNLTVTQVRITVTTAVKQPTATLYLNGHDYVGSYTGANDTAVGTEEMAAQDTLTCKWIGADVGATAKMTVFGYQED